jgi:hypothetical protein
MSVGKVNSNGDKGNNFPWQFKMLQGLQAIVDGNCCKEMLDYVSTIAKTIAPQERVIKIQSVSGPGSTDTGAYSISIANVGAAAGTVDTIPLPAGVTLNFDAGALNNTFPNKVNFDATGTTFLITVIVSA